MAAAPAGGAGFTVTVDRHEMGRFLRELRDWDKAFYNATRKRLRIAGEAGVKDVQRRILTGPHTTPDTGLRRGLAGGTKVSIKTGTRSAGVSITTTGAKLDAAQRAMVKAYNLARFRHPVHGHDDRWVQQRGRPYFGTVLEERQRDMRAAVEAAVADAARTMTSGETRS